MIAHCPACHRKLISHISPCCNWCGHEIQDAAYQEEAEIRRQAHAIEQAQHDAQAKQWFQSTVDAYAPGGFGVNVPLGPMRRPHLDLSQDIRQRMAAESAIAAEAAQARRAQQAALAAAKAEEERLARQQEEANEAKAKSDNRFNHLEF